MAKRSQALLCAVGQPCRDSLKDFLDSKVREDDMGLFSPGATRWTRVRHATHRLLSYLSAAEAFLGAHRLWPELFVDVEVIPVASNASTVPGGPKALRIRTSASGIIARMTYSDSIVNACLCNMSKMERMGLDLDGQVRRAVGRFAPFVHAELLVDDAIRRRRRSSSSSNSSGLADREPPPFFRETEFGRYIGSSQPACRLCALYLAAQADGVQVRPAHDSQIGYNWRAPDVLESDGAGVEKRRRAAVERMVVEIRRDAIKAIESQVFVGTYLTPLPSNKSPNLEEVAFLASNFLHTVEPRPGNLDDRGAWERR